MAIYKPFNNENREVTSNIKSLITNNKEDIILPKERISKIDIEPYTPQFNLESKTENSQPLGRLVYKNDKIDIGNTTDLLNEFSKAGINLRITSGRRPNATTKQGNKSWHSEGFALDVTPIQGETFEDLKSKIMGNPSLVKWLNDNEYGILDETTPEALSKTGGTGAHWHIGKDRIARQQFQNWFLKDGGKIPIFQNGSKINAGVHYTPYTVKNGDTLSEISSTFGVPLASLTSLNAIQNQNKIKEGEELLIPKANIGYRKIFNDLFPNQEARDNYVEMPREEVVETQEDNKYTKLMKDRWDSETIQLFDSLFNDHALGKDNIIKFIFTESGFDHTAKSPYSSATGLGQFTQATALDRFGKDIAGQYLTNSRSLQDQLQDLKVYFDWTDKHIKNERDKLTFGRLKVNGFAPYKRLDDIIPANIFKHSLGNDIKSKLKQGKSTFRDLMNAFDSSY